MMFFSTVFLTESSFLLTLIEILYLVSSVDINSGKGNGESSAIRRENWVDPIVFSKLSIPPETLFGARWVIENKWKTNVSFSIEVVDATLIHTDELTLRIEFNLRQMWTAHGLEYPEGLFKAEDPDAKYITTDFRVLNFIWSPDSYVSTARESNMETVGQHLSLVYLFKNFSIIYKVRMFTKVACSASFEWYPLDVQSCDFVIESYKYHEKQVFYHWTPEHLYRPVLVRTKRLLQYELRTPVYFDSGAVSRGGRGVGYPFVRLKFIFERKLGNNLIQVYTPTLLVVVLSWFSFWLGLDAIPGRISLLVTCMLTLVTMHGGIKRSIPPVHYITMMDVWLVFCMGSVFGAMCEFVVVKYISWRHELGIKASHYENNTKLHDITQQFRKLFGKKEQSNIIKVQSGELPYASEMYWNQSKKITPVNEMLRTIVVEAAVSEDLMKLTKTDKEKNNGESAQGKEITYPLWVKIDKFSRAGFPGCFLLFCLIYWPVLYSSGTAEYKTMHDL